MVQKLILTFILSLIAVALLGQTQYATTKIGQKVILKSDGTWEYAKSNSNSSNRFISETSNSTPKTTNSRTKSGASSKAYIRGPRGGCYYINSNGNKTYVDRSLCD